MVAILYQLSYAVLPVPDEVIEASLVGCLVNQIEYSWSPHCLLQGIITQFGFMS
jgi:hypothetical protein